MTEPSTIIRRFLFLLNSSVLISLDRNYWEVINLLFVLPELYLSILKTEKILQFLGQKILNVRGTSFQHKRLIICVGNWLRTITSDRIVYNDSSLSFSFELVGDDITGQKLLRSNKFIICFAWAMFKYT